MSLSEIRAAANHLRGLQQKASATVAAQGEGWQRELVAIRREIASGIAELSATTRNWSPPDGAGDEQAALVKGVNAVRRTLAMHQALWPAVTLNPADPDFKASVAQVREAYDDLFTQLDTLDARMARADLRRPRP